MNLTCWAKVHPSGGIAEPRCWVKVWPSGGIVEPICWAKVWPSGGITKPRHLALCRPKSFCKAQDTYGPRARPQRKPVQWPKDARPDAPELPALTSALSNGTPMFRFAFAANPETFAKIPLQYCCRKKVGYHVIQILSHPCLVEASLYLEGSLRPYKSQTDLTRLPSLWSPKDTCQAA